jgi:hypothetical protein
MLTASLITVNGILFRPTEFRTHPVTLLGLMLYHSATLLFVLSDPLISLRLSHVQPILPFDSMFQISIGSNSWISAQLVAFSPQPCPLLPLFAPAGFATLENAELLDLGTHCLTWAHTAVSMHILQFFCIVTAAALKRSCTETHPHLKRIRI